jgi:phosphopantothenoylcysteine decarboxylase/phosphopantothenate--cysteine ligase
MDLDMYQHPSVLGSLAKLKSYGNIIIDSEYGELASGLVGEGRMAEPENLTEFLEEFFTKNGKMKGKKVLITAGPTYEAIDPVRFIGNHSSGKMGLAIARQALNEGAAVTVILGPNNLQKDAFAGLNIINITSASEMYDAAQKEFKTSDIVILAAAVADYTPAEPATQKIKKQSAEFELNLKKTIDIAQQLGEQKSGQFMVGFALETENEQSNAIGKMERKNLDMIVLNSLNTPGAGFQQDTNKITIFYPDNKMEEFELKDKTEVAKDIINAIADKIS